MSFGFSVGDFAALGQLAWKIYKACKDAPDSFKNLSQEVSSLHLVLKEVEETCSDSTLSAPQQSRLENVGDGCRAVLEDLQCSLDKYNSLGTKSKRTWDRLGWGSKDIAELRLRLISNTVMLTTLVNTSQINVQKKLDVFMQEFRDGKHEGSVISTRTVDSLSADERQAWRAIRKELEDIGISVAAFDANKDFIVNWFKTAISTGAFEEQTKEAETSSIFSHDDLSQSLEELGRDTFLTQHLEDQEHATNSTSASVKLQSSRLSREAKGQRRRPPRIAGLVNWLFRNSDELHKAVQIQDETRIRQLLEKGVDINMKDDQGKTALHEAVFLDNKTIVGLLLTKGANINAKDNYKCTALHLAAEKSYESMAQLLLLHGAEIDEKDKDGRTGLHFVAKSGDREVAQLLLKHGAKIEEKDDAGYTALHWAASYGHATIVQILLSHGAKIDEKDAGQYTALHQAVESGHETVVQLLLENGANVIGKDWNGWTALHSAAKRGQKIPMQLLLKYGASMKETNIDRNTALHTAVIYSNLTVAQLLLQKEAEEAVWQIIEMADGAGKTALHLAVESGNEKMAQLLLKYGASGDEQDGLGKTALHLATESGDVKMFQLLLKNGVTIDKRVNQLGDTALHLAVRSGNEKMMQLLLKNGAKIDEVSGDGKTALQLANESKQGEMANILISAKQQISAKQHRLQYHYPSTVG